MNLKRELSSRCVLLIIIILLCVIGVHFAYDAITAPKAFETINVFVTASRCDHIKLGKTIQDAIGVKTTISGYALDDKYYKESLQTSGLLMSDLLILPKSLLPENSIDKEFAPLKEAELTEYGIDCENLEFYVKNNQNYALKIYDNTTKLNLMKQWAEFDGEDYYLVINISRPNAAPYSAAKTTTSNAFSALAIILKPST